jgi:hypothetical protein
VNNVIKPAAPTTSRQAAAAGSFLLHSEPTRRENNKMTYFPNPWNVLTTSIIEDILGNIEMRTKISAKLFLNMLLMRKFSSVVGFLRSLADENPKL